MVHQEPDNTQMNLSLKPDNGWNACPNIANSYFSGALLNAILNVKSIGH